MKPLKRKRTGWGQGEGEEFRKYTCHSEWLEKKKKISLLLCTFVVTFISQRNPSCPEGGLKPLGQEGHLWLFCLPRSSAVTEHLPVELPGVSPRGACPRSRLVVSWGHPLPRNWERSQRWHKQPPTLRHLDWHRAQRVVGSGRAGHHGRNLPDPEDGITRGVQLPPIKPPGQGNSGRRERTRTAAVSWQVSRSLPKCSAEASHSPITATLTAAQILGRQPQLQPHRAKVSATHLGDWQEDLPCCSAKDGFSTCSWIQNRFPQPEIRNRVSAGRPVFHHPGFLAFWFATKARFSCWNDKSNMHSFPTLNYLSFTYPPSNFLTNVKTKPSGSKTGGFWPNHIHQGNFKHTEPTLSSVVNEESMKQVEKQDPIQDFKMALHHFIFFEVCGVRDKIYITWNLPF